MKHLKCGKFSVFMYLSLLAAVALLQPAGVSAKESNVLKITRDFETEHLNMVVDNEFIVVLNEQGRRSMVVNQSDPGKPSVNIPSLQCLIESQGVVRFTRQFPDEQSRPAGTKYPDMTGHFKVMIPEGADLEATLAVFERDPSVDHVEKIGIHPVYLEPNDPYYQNSPSPTFPYDQWHYWLMGCGIGANLAWDVETGSPDVVVAVADTGGRYMHRDLGGTDRPGPRDALTNGNVWVNTGEVPEDSADNDGNGYADDVIGYDFVSSTESSCLCCDSDCRRPDNDPKDHNGHGTHVGGTISAITNNDRMVAGVAGGFSNGTTVGAGNGVKVMFLRIGWNASCYGQCGYGFIRMDYAAEAMNYVSRQVELGVNVAAFNASWSSSNTGGIDAAVNNLLAHDVMLIHAAGNSNSSYPDYLGGKAGVMNVAATDRFCRGASFTNHGHWVDLAAPGVDIVSTYHHYEDPKSDYVAVLDGTSMAAPHACGVAALLESCAPALTGVQKFNIMISTTTPYTDTRYLGTGILNAKNALSQAGCGGMPDCTIDADCDDADACTVDTCVNGTCTHTALDCDDNDACTYDDCDPAIGCYYASMDCNDGNSCTTDTCEPVLGCHNDWPPCQNSDGCCPPGCDFDNDSDCPPNPDCKPFGEYCLIDDECCSKKCRGRKCKK
ncbi:S8 family serine peptidase [Acidobacteriota bacterium]